MIPLASILSHVDLSQTSKIDLEQAGRFWEGRGAGFGDGRDSEAYQEAHIPGARSIPLREVLRRSNELPKDAQIITYCVKLYT